MICSIANSEIPGYKLFRRDRGSKGGGVAVCVKSEIVALRRSDLEDPKFEGLWLEISLPKTCGFLMGTFYRPPNSSKYHDNDWLDWITVLITLYLKVRRCLCWEISTVTFYPREQAFLNVSN